MCAHGHGFAVFRPESSLIGKDGGGILAVGHNGNRRFGEDSFQRGRIVHQHVAGGGAHEYLDSARMRARDSPNLLQVIVGRPEVEGVIAEATVPRPAELVLKRPPIGGGRRGIGHLHHAGHAAANRRPRLGSQRALVRKAGLAKVHLVVDQAGQQVAPLQVDDLEPCLGRHPRLDFANAFPVDEDVDFPDLTLIDQLGIGQKHPGTRPHSSRLPQKHRATPLR